MFFRLSERVAHMVDPTWFAGRLRELRTAAGLTRDELGERSGIAGRSIEGLEQGRVLPAWATALALAEALGVTVLAFTTEPAKVPEEVLRGGRPRKVEEKPKRKRRAK